MRSKNKFKTEDMATVFQKMNNLFSRYPWSMKIQETVSSKHATVKRRYKTAYQIRERCAGMTLTSCKGEP